MKRIAVSLILLVAVGCAKPAPPPTTILIVRHAEKLSEGTDPDLNPAGMARAKALAAVAANAGVETAYVTQFKRTKETAAPLGVPMTEVPVNLSTPGDYPNRLADTIKSKSAGQVVLVVSHSNTIPAVIETLTHVKIAPLGDQEYDRLYVVTLPAEGAPRLIAAQYGH